MKILLGNDFVMREPEPLHPELGVMLNEEVRTLSEEDLVSQITRLNSSINPTQILRAKKNPASTILFLRLKPEAYKILSHTCFIGFSRCRTFQSKRILRCFHCQALGHTADKCSSPLRCSRCGEEGTHSADSCHSVNPSCCLCGSHEHTVHDPSLCPVQRKAQAVLVSRTYDC